VKSTVFNVLDHGAKDDDETDNTEAFSACDGGASIRARRIGSANAIQC